ncbi:MAG TPA: hypothetical protein VNL39_12285 [Xanthobacteraceae bacterium]|nr:hypothetical protein [Xanthobacteraceae bacterium]
MSRIVRADVPRMMEDGHIAWSLLRFLLRAALVAVVLALAGCPIAYILWPRWPDAVPIDAPKLPITVGGMALNVPAAAIRIPRQRSAGAQERIDLVFLWPSLEPPDPAARPAPDEAPTLSDRIFVTIAKSDGTLPPAERFHIIYPRYTEGDPAAGPDGLRVQSFRKDTPYRNEDLLYDAAAPDRFLVRCTRKAGIAPGICLHEQRFGNTDVIVRFPRDWLSDWRAVAANIDRLFAKLRAGR